MLSGDSKTLWIDFGGILTSQGHADAAFDILASVATPGLTARLNLTAVEGSGDTAVLYLLSGDTAFENLPAGSAKPYIFRFDASAAGDYSAQYIFHFSDEALPGAASYVLTLNLSGSSVPEPGTVVLLGLGLLALVRRRRG